MHKKCSHNKTLWLPRPAMMLDFYYILTDSHIQILCSVYV